MIEADIDRQRLAAFDVWVYRRTQNISLVDKVISNEIFKKQKKAGVF